MTYLVYGKKKTDKRFSPFDMSKNRFVVNLFHASMFTIDDMLKLKKEVDYMNQHNSEYQFEIRRQRT